MTIATHPLPFHADDLVAGALMRTYFNRSGHVVDFIFSRDPDVLQHADAVVDTGGIHDERALRFDHHQDKNAARAATGMVARFLAQKHEFRWLSALMPSFDRIDAADLGRATEDSKVSRHLTLFNPTWKELRAGRKADKEMNTLERTCLARALPVVATALEAAYLSQKVGLNTVEIFEASITNNPDVILRKTEIEKAKQEGQAMFVRAAKAAKGGLIYTEQGIEFAELFSSRYLTHATPDIQQCLEQANYVVFPAKGLGFSAVAVPTPDNPMAQKHPFPESWRGKRGGELMQEVSASTGKNLANLTGSPADYFCHHSGFFLTMPDPVAFTDTLAFCSRNARISGQAKNKVISSEAIAVGGMEVR